MISCVGLRCCVSSCDIMCVLMFSWDCWRFKQHGNEILK